MIFEGRELVKNDHIKVKWESAVFNQPLKVLTIDDGDICGGRQCNSAFFYISYCNRIGQVFKVRPFLDFSGPCIAGDAERCDDEDPVNFKTVEQQVFDGRQADYSFAKAHIEENRSYRMRFDIVYSIFLIIMWLEVHPASLQSALRCRSHIL